MFLVSILNPFLGGGSRDILLLSSIHGNMLCCVGTRGMSCNEVSRSYSEKKTKKIDDNIQHCPHLGGKEYRPGQPDSHRRPIIPISTPHTLAAGLSLPGWSPAAAPLPIISLSCPSPPPIKPVPLALPPATIYPSSPSISNSNGVIGPGLPAGSKRGLFGSFFFPARPALPPIELAAAILACAIISRWYCCIFCFTSEVFLSCPCPCPCLSLLWRFWIAVGIARLVSGNDAPVALEEEADGVATVVVEGDW